MSTALDRNVIKSEFLVSRDELLSAVEANEIRLALGTIACLPSRDLKEMLQYFKVLVNGGMKQAVEHQYELLTEQDSTLAKIEQLAKGEADAEDKIDRVIRNRGWWDRLWASDEQAIQSSVRERRCLSRAKNGEVEVATARIRVMGKHLTDSIVLMNRLMFIYGQLKIEESRRRSILWHARYFLTVTATFRRVSTEEACVRLIPDIHEAIKEA